MGTALKKQKVRQAMGIKKGAQESEARRKNIAEKGKKEVKKLTLQVTVYGGRGGRGGAALGTEQKWY